MTVLAFCGEGNDSENSFACRKKTWANLDKEIKINKTENKQQQ